MPVLLDTDHLSVLQWQEQPAYDRLLARLDRLAPDDIATNIVSFQEQAQGWLAYLNRAKKPDQIVEAYQKLEVFWRSFLRMNVVSFTADAQSRFTVLRRQYMRLESLGARIAGIALATDSVVDAQPSAFSRDRRSRCRRLDDCRGVLMARAQMARAQLPAEALLNDVVAKAMTPPLKAAKFRKSGMQYHRRHRETVQVVNIQVSHGSSSTEKRFYVNAGVAFDGICELAGVPVLERPKEYECDKACGSRD